MRILSVDVNVGYFKDAKSLEELKQEPGRIFGHLSDEEQDAGYNQLWEEIQKGKTVKVSAATPAPESNASSTTATNQTADQVKDDKKAGSK